MIAKRVLRTKGTSSFKNLGRYILDVEERGNPATWQQTAEYILDTKGEGKKVGGVRVTHCHSDEPGFAIKEIIATQAMNTRSKSDKTYHLVVSFPPGERPTVEQLHDIEDTLCAAIGLADHQRLSAVHTDTEHLHMHIAINKVHPRTLRNVEPYYDQQRLMAACEQLEITHQLTRTNHGKVVTPGMGSRLSTMETQAGQESLLRWIKENASEALKACYQEGTNWQAMHATLARFDLEIRPRGAGLVIAQRGSRIAVKASSVDRQLAMKALTGRWGAYEPPTDQEQQAKPAERHYRKAPLHRHPGTAQLYADYQRQREAAVQARQESGAQLREAHERYAQELKAWYAERRQAIRRNARLSRLEKRAAYKELAQRRRQDWAQRRQAEADQRKALAEAHLLPTWQAFLQQAADHGDTLALAVLRSRQQRQPHLAANLLRAEDADEARHIVFQHLQPRARKNGAMVYHIEDGGVVADEAHQVRVEQMTAGAAFLALALADERYKDQALIVEGSDEFKSQVAQLAALQGLRVRFADPALEQQRQQLAAERAAPAQISPALDAYIAQRNALRQKIASIDYHRPWMPSDAGEVIYQGRRRLTDGSEAVLLKRGDEMLVKAVSSAQAARASQWSIGQAVTLDEQGHFVSRDRDLSPTRSKSRQR